MEGKWRKKEAQMMIIAHINTEVKPPKSEIGKYTARQSFLQSANVKVASISDVGSRMEEIGTSFAAGNRILRTKLRHVK